MPVYLYQNKPLGLSNTGLLMCMDFHRGFGRAGFCCCIFALVFPAAPQHNHPVSHFISNSIC